MIDRHRRRDSGNLEPLVGRDQIAQARVGIGEMVESRRMRLALRDSRKRRDRNPMMFVVVSHKREELVFVRDRRVQHRAIPFGHFLEARGAQNRVREFRRSDPFRLTVNTVRLCRHRRSSCASLRGHSRAHSPRPTIAKFSSPPRPPQGCADSRFRGTPHRRDRHPHSGFALRCGQRNCYSTKWIVRASVKRSISVRPRLVPRAINRQEDF